MLVSELCHLEDPRLEVVSDMAGEIIRKRPGNSEAVKPSPKWASRFVAKHREVLADSSFWQPFFDQSATRSESARQRQDVRRLTDDDCGTCHYCKDKPKFGGPGTLRKKCLKKRKREEGRERRRKAKEALGNYEEIKT